MTIKIGTQFRSTYADSNPLWTVIQKRGRGTWLAEINASELDYAGVQGAFTSEQINASIQWSRHMKQSGDSSENFFKGLSIGSIVHYSNGFNSYVRCQVTNDHRLLPIALVGNWQEYDLPRRMDNGEIYAGYHVDQIKAGKVFRPHASNVWEYYITKTAGSQPINFPKWTDPRQLVPVSLEVPLMNPTQALKAAKHQKLDRIRAILKSEAEPDVIFNQLKIVLESN